MPTNTPGTTFQGEAGLPPAAEPTPAWKYFVPGLGEYLMVKDLLSASRAGDPVGVGLSGLGLLPFAGAGITRAARRGYGYHGTRGSVDDILKGGFKKGSSAELMLAGTSTTLDPTVALRSSFAAGHPERIVAVEFKTKPVPLKPSDYIAERVPQEDLIYSTPNLGLSEAETFAPRTQSPGAEKEIAELLLRRKEFSKERQNLLAEMGKQQESKLRTELRIKFNELNSADTRIENRIQDLRVGDVPSLVARALKPSDQKFIETAREDAADASRLIYNALRSGYGLPGRYQLNRYGMWHPGPLYRKMSAVTSYKMASEQPAIFATFALSDLSKGIEKLQNLPGESLTQTYRIFEAAAPLLKYKGVGAQDEAIAAALGKRLRQWKLAAEAVKDVGSNTLPNKRRLANTPALARDYNTGYSQLMAARSTFLEAIQRAAATPIGRSLASDKVIQRALAHDPEQIVLNMKTIDKGLAGKPQTGTEALALETKALTMEGSLTTLNKLYQNQDFWNKLDIPTKAAMTKALKSGEDLEAYSVLKAIQMKWGK